MAAHKIIVIGTISGLVAFAALLALVFASGSTFGQRCSKLFPSDTDRYAQCVADLDGSKRDG